jgi:predicted  nucleic acid-binding Zn-ribbon protein
MQIETEVIVGFLMAAGGSVAGALLKRSIGDLDRRINTMADELGVVKRDVIAADKNAARVEERLIGIERLLNDMRSDLRDALRKLGDS